MKNERLKNSESGSSNKNKTEYSKIMKEKSTSEKVENTQERTNNRMQRKQSKTWEQKEHSKKSQTDKYHR